MCLADVEMIFEEWNEHPPTHVLVAAYLGVKPKSSEPEPPPLSDPPPLPGHLSIAELRLIAMKHVKGQLKERDGGNLRIDR